MAEEKKETVEAEVVSEEEKKEGKFGKWWKGVKKNLSDSALEAKIESVYNDTHESFEVTPYDAGLFGGKTVHGEIKDGLLTIFGKEEIKVASVVIAEKDKKAYYVKSVAPSKVKIAVDGIEYERDGQDIVLDENVSEVKVIKADGRYFLYQGE